MGCDLFALFGGSTECSSTGAAGSGLTGRAPRPVPPGRNTDGMSSRSGRKMFRKMAEIQPAQSNGNVSTWPACHSEYQSGCARCRYRAFGAKWAGVYGVCERRQNAARVERITWLSQCPFRPGKTWGIGCTLCAEFSWRWSQLAAGGAKLGNKRKESTAWARFEVRALSQMQACTILQHSRTNMHQLAVRAHFRQHLPVRELLADDCGCPADSEGRGTSARALVAGLAVC